MARKSRKITQTEDCAVKTAPIFSSWIYARISNESSHAEDSIDNQTAICREYINAESELTLGGVYTDLGFSGTNFERPGYSDMMAGIMSGEVKCIVVKDLSRLGRTYIEVGELLFDTFVQRGIRFISVNDRYDSFADDAGRKKLLILFKNLVNHMYSRDIGKKIKSAKKQRAEPAGNAPYGYRKSADGKRLAVDREAAEIVKMIFALRLNGESVSGISRYMNQNLIPSPQQRRYQLGEISHEIFSERILWPPTLVSKILRNETYTGTLFQGKYECSGKNKKLLPRDKWVVHENAHEAIISKERFEAVSRLMNIESERYQHKNEREHIENRYAGIIMCSRCGKTAIRSDNRMKEPVLFYYSCRFCCEELKREGNLPKAPKLPLTKLDALIMAALRVYMDTLVQFERLPEILSKSDPLIQKRAKIAKDKAQLEKTVNDYEKTLSAAYTHHLEGLLDLREYQIIREKIENDKANAEARLALLCDEQAKYDIQNALGNKWLVQYKAYRDCEIPTKDMINALIERIILTPITNDVEIVLNFKDSFEELRQLMEEGGVTVDV